MIPAMHTARFCGPEVSPVLACRLSRAQCINQGQRNMSRVPNHFALRLNGGGHPLLLKGTKYITKTLFETEKKDLGS